VFLLSKAANWQAHLGAVFAGLVTFVVSLCILKILETGSREIAWRSSAPGYLSSDLQRWRRRFAYHMFW
jgi:hypothetical protein